MNDRERLLTYYTAAILRPPPRLLCVNATLRCDGHCGHCGIWREPAGDEFRPDELRRALATPFFQRIETAWITGGEPTLREDLAEVARAMVESLSGLRTLGLATNALDPGRVEDRVRAMREAAGPGRSLFVHLSLDGLGEIHDRVRQRPGAFAAAVETIGRLERLRAEAGAPIELGLNCVIQPANLVGLEALSGFARERGLPLTFNVALVTNQIYRNQAFAAGLALGPEERLRVAAFLRSIAPASPPALRYQYRLMQEVLAGRPQPGRCLTLYSTVNINADGSLIPCPASSDLFPRNALVEDMAALWRSDEAEAMRGRVRRELCPGCMLSCSLGDSMPLSEWLRGGWEGKAGPIRRRLGRRRGGRDV
jgi:MoaA/NifB/PqqE/SkfB family radical SAM enzyme